MATAACAAMVLAAPAQAAPLTCGHKVTTSVTLSADITNCPEDGLIVGADNITIDLGGHAITAGAGSGGMTPNYSDGIDVDGHTGVTIRHGSITGFLYSISSRANATATTMVNLAVDCEIFLDGDRNRADRIDVNSAQYHSGAITLHGNAISITRSQTYGYGAIDVLGDGATIDANTVVEAYAGIFVSGFAPRVTRNTVANVIIGMNVDSSSGGVIEGNQVSALAPSGFYGIKVNGTSSTRVVRNTATGFDWFGLGITGALVKANTANDNPGVGIDASNGAIDGGGNSASGNGVADCIGVAC